MLRDMLLPEGGFASALDADTQGEEGLTYVWTPGQIRAALERRRPSAPSPTTASPSPATSRARTSCAPSGSRPGDLEGIRLALLGARARRPQPGRDDKAIACWNGLALAALAEAGWRLGQPDDWDAARGAARPSCWRR